MGRLFSLLVFLAASCFWGAFIALGLASSLASRPGVPSTDVLAARSGSDYGVGVGWGFEG